MKSNVVVPRVDTWAGLSVRTAGARENPTQVVVMLHGWGASGDDLVPLSQVLAAPGRLFVFPEAPLVTMGGGRAWWHLDLARIEKARVRGEDRDLRQDEPQGLPAVRATMVALLAEISQRTQVPLAKIVVGGFSQGAMVATDLALMSAEKPGALVALSGTLVSEGAWTKALASLNRDFPVFVSHGEGDVVLPFRLAEALTQTLRAGTDKLTWVPFRGGHEIPGVVIEKLAAFLAANM